MIYLQLKERLGNQFFQYAFARTLMEETGDSLTINIEEYVKKNQQSKGWRNQLDEFNVKPFQIINGCSIKNPNISLLLKIVLNIFRRKFYSTPKEKQHQVEKKFAPILNRLGVFWCMEGYIQPHKPYKFIKDKYIFGYFESPKFFKLVDKELKNELTAKEPLIDSNKELYEKIKNSNSICVTVRRGDFLNDEFKSALYICNEEYFKRGVDYIKSKVPDAIVFVFSDDIEWAKENLNYGETYYETGNDPVWEKLRLMSACKHFVISNSTFSWWAQHLSLNNEKIVVAPSRWRNDDLTVDIYEENWNIIEV